MASHFRRLLTAGLLFAALPSVAADWRLKWSDEFDGASGAAPDLSRWTFETGAGGWGNNELEHYCAPGEWAEPCDANRPNAYLDGQGRLVIEASKDAKGRWTSARMKSAGRLKYRYGRIEARMKLPVGAGLWPAFWFLGADVSTEGWPKCGEIDVMESIPAFGDNPLGPTTIGAALHGQGYSGGHGLGNNFTFPHGGRVDSEYHVYGVVWTKNKIQFYVDDWTKPFFTATPGDVPNGSEWKFDHDFFMILNLAVGGDWPGLPDAGTPDPARMLIDYVRVYEPINGFDSL